MLRPTAGMTDGEMMDHRYIDDFQIAEHYLTNALTPEDRREFADHISECDECWDRLQLAKIWLEQDPAWQQGAPVPTVLHPDPTYGQVNWKAHRQIGRQGDRHLDTPGVRHNLADRSADPENAERTVTVGPFVGRGPGSHQTGSHQTGPHQMEANQAGLNGSGATDGRESNGAEGHVRFRSSPFDAATFDSAPFDAHTLHEAAFDRAAFESTGFNANVFVDTAADARETLHFAASMARQDGFEQYSGTLALAVRERNTKVAPYFRPWQVPTFTTLAALLAVAMQVIQQQQMELAKRAENKDAAEPIPMMARFVMQFEPWQLVLIGALAAMILLLMPATLFLWELRRVIAP